MELKRLEYFLKIVKHQSFTLASYDCAISQPALSQHMKALEQELKVKLFVKRGRSFALTEAGRILSRSAPALLEHAQNLTLQVRGAAAGSSIVQAGILSYVRDPNLGALIEEVLSRHDLKCAVHALSHEAIYQGLSMGRLDFAISDQRRVFNEASYANHKIRAAAWKIECDQALFPERKRIETQALRDLKLAAACESEHHQGERAFLRDMLMVGEVIFKEDLCKARALASKGKAVCAVLDLARHPGPDSDGLKTITLTLKGRQITSNLCLFAKKPVPASLSAALNELKECLGAL